MKWNKLGKIFNPNDYKWADDFIGFAQSPQTIVFDDFVRVYFSIRKKDGDNKFISHIQFVDFELDMKTIRMNITKGILKQLGFLEGKK
mgnify:FL=1